MSDARAMLAELQAAGILDPDADFETAMDDLASSAAPMLFPMTRHAQGVVYVSERQQQLLDELQALARAPYWPEHPLPLPAIPLERLVADFRRSTGRRLDVTLRWEAYSDGGYWMCSITVDGEDRGGCNVDDDAGPEVSLAELADRLCEGWLHEEVWGGWPLCSRHLTRPMWAVVNAAGFAAWRCEADPNDEVEIGQLGT